MNAGPGDIEIPSGQRIVMRDFESQLAFDIFAKFGYRCVIDGWCVALYLCVFYNQCLQGRKILTSSNRPQITEITAIIFHASH